MKALFPCEGSIIVNKQDLDPMNAFYNTQLMKSNMTEYLKTTNAITVANTKFKKNCEFIISAELLLEIINARTTRKATKAVVILFEYN